MTGDASDVQSSSRLRLGTSPSLELIGVEVRESSPQNLVRAGNLDQLVQVFGLPIKSATAIELDMHLIVLKEEFEKPLDIDSGLWYLWVRPTRARMLQVRVFVSAGGPWSTKTRRNGSIRSNGSWIEALVKKIYMNSDRTRRQLVISLRAFESVDQVASSYS
ncbi:hypothetical protein EK21DRAFT_108612 [Setomelanomma holmii]|uniref:Uncharacterized protein n=1 Tax=Setomelanomma holmii TaxID=210430 RepID=A0A9P4HGY1_9PLEO|nr:hypothetical protein EK21DRAFT_108612 [Setomelanomma holmii]